MLTQFYKNRLQNSLNVVKTSYFDEFVVIWKWVNFKRKTSGSTGQSSALSTCVAGLKYFDNKSMRSLAAIGFGFYLRQCSIASLLKLLRSTYLSDVIDLLRALCVCAWCLCVCVCTCVLLGEEASVCHIQSGGRVGGCPAQEQESAADGRREREQTGLGSAHQETPGQSAMSGFHIGREGCPGISPPPPLKKLFFSFHNSCFVRFYSAKTSQKSASLAWIDECIHIM